MRVELWQFVVDMHGRCALWIEDVVSRKYHVDGIAKCLYCCRARNFLSDQRWRHHREFSIFVRITDRVYRLNLHSPNNNYPFQCNAITQVVEKSIQLI